ncbi:MAG: bifunctional alpha,alpha-trehalose-phosphate synthase (UDP-forming)/trehalose-phosphatase [Bacteroidota bacterium]|nr:bifunctional alpha,alpha-trehalose-phosphate synthase (UDP-forming)/trehalose-phosphatase [Bacteroidota bacterium]
MKRLFVAASILPVNIQLTGNNYHIQPGDELTSSGLQDFYKGFHTQWIGHTGIENHDFNIREIRDLKSQLENYNCFPVFPDPEEHNKYLHGFASNTLWPLFHYFPQNVVYDNESWKAYTKINQLYAEKILHTINENDYLWIHSYHLLLLPNLIKQKMPNLSIGIFMHLPFPSFEIFRLLPWRVEIIEGMLGADLVGFHTYDYVRHFLSCVRRLMGHDTDFNRISIGERTLKVDAFPKGINFNKIQVAAKTTRNENSKKSKSQIRNEVETFLMSDRGKKIILSIGHLEYSMGIPYSLRAFEMFLQQNPQYLEKVDLILLALPSGESGMMYKQLKKEVDELVGRINGNFGSITWMPIRYLNQDFILDELIEIYKVADIGLILPLRDGMNLVAKEFVASQFDGKGVLILSELAGASKELHEALLVNPNNLNEIVDAIKEALEMPGEEQSRRIAVMTERLKRYNIERWAKGFIKSMEGVKKLQQTNLTKKLTIIRINQIISKYKNTKNRILFLDYDGTLSWFKKNPEDAKPDEELYNILRRLSEDKNNTIVIISGRDKDTLGRWFDESWNIHFVAEHGVWLRQPKADWHMMEQIDNKWKEAVRPLLEFYVDQTPGSFIENKNFSLVWHYRKADPDLGVQRSWELRDELRTLTSNLNLEIMDGDKVIEIKYSGINKGKASLQKIGNRKFDFILAVGDDWTDEYTFNVMPDEAFTIKVGTKTTKASYYIESVDQVRKVLDDFTK